MTIIVCESDEQAKAMQAARDAGDSAALLKAMGFTPEEVEQLLPFAEQARVEVLLDLPAASPIPQ